MLSLTSAKAISFSCAFANVGHAVLGEIYSCTANVSVTTATIYLQYVSGEHQPGRNHDNVQALIISDQYSFFIPSRVEKFFKNIIALSVIRTPMSSFKAFNLQEFPQLKFLQVNSGGLTELNDLFGGFAVFTPVLHVLHFPNNKIANIGQDLLTNLEHLRWLDLQNNSCIDKAAYDRTAVLDLLPQVSVLCPPDGTLSTTQPTTTQATTTTTEGTTEQCSCNEEIQELKDQIERLQGSDEELRLENQQQASQIQELQQSNEKLLTLLVDFKTRLEEVEMKLREVSSTPCAN